MLRFGMPTLIELPEIEDCAALCRELSLSFIELNLNLPQYQTHNMDVQRLRAAAREYGISYTMHIDENLNPGDFNIYVAESYRKTALESIRLAKELGVPVLNMHLYRGVRFTLPDRKVYLYDEYLDTYMSNMRLFRDECEAAIGEADIKICVENFCGYSQEQLQVLDMLLESPVFGLTYDVGHNHCQRGIDEPITLERVSRLHHMHLHDAKDGTKDHLALGKGVLDVARYLNLAKEHQLSVVLETKTVAGLTESVQYLRKNFE